MAKVVSAVTALVEVIGRPKESKHQEGSYYYPCLFLDESRTGDDAKIWKNLSGNEVSQIQQGDRVQLVPVGTDKSGNPKHNIVLLDGSAPAPAATEQTASKPGAWSDDRKRELARKAQQTADFLAFCHQQVRAKLPDLADEGAIATLTATLFQQSLK